MNTTMLLAEALRERADAQTRLVALKQRLAEVARVQEDESPAEDPQVLLDEAARLIERSRRLIVAINLTNTATMLEDGTTVTEALARRDELATRVRLVSELAHTAGRRLARFGRAELREVPTVDVAALRAQADRLADERRALDARLQRLNWTTELTASP